MSLIPQVTALFNKEVGSLVGAASNMLISRFPGGTVANPSVATAGLAITAAATPTYSAWTTIVAISKVTNPTWISGVCLEVPANAGANETWSIDLAQGAAGAEVSFSTGTINQGALALFSENWLSSVGMATVNATHNLPVLLKHVGALRVSAALAGLVTGGKAAAVSFFAIANVGS